MKKNVEKYILRNYRDKTGRDGRNGTGGTANFLFLRDGTGQGRKIKIPTGRDMSRPFYIPARTPL